MTAPIYKEINKQFTLSENVVLDIKFEKECYLIIHNISFNLDVDEVHGLETIFGEAKNWLETTLFFDGSDYFGYYGDIDEVPKTTDDFLHKDYDDEDDEDDEDDLLHKNFDDESDENKKYLRSRHCDNSDEKKEILFRDERIKALKTLDSFLEILEIQFLYTDWEDYHSTVDRLQSAG